MNRRVLLLVAVAAAGVMAVGTGGFSAATLERGVQVNIADRPATGLVGVTYHPDSVSVEYGSNDMNGSDPREPVRLLTLQNNLGRRVAFTVVIEDSRRAPPKLKNVPSGGRLTRNLGMVNPGKSVDLRVSIVCAANEGETWDLRIIAVGEDGTIHVRLTREVTINCESPSAGGSTPHSPHSPAESSL